MYLEKVSNFRSNRELCVFFGHFLMAEKQVKILYEDFLSIIYFGYSIDMSDYEKEEWMIFLNQV